MKADQHLIWHSFSLSEHLSGRWIIRETFALEENEIYNTQARKYTVGFFQKITFRAGNFIVICFFFLEYYINIEIHF